MEIKISEILFFTISVDLKPQAIHTTTLSDIGSHHAKTTQDLRDFLA